MKQVNSRGLSHHAIEALSLAVSKTSISSSEGPDGEVKEAPGPSDCWVLLPNGEIIEGSSTPTMVQVCWDTRG